MGDKRTLEIPTELYERIQRLAAVREKPVVYLLEDAYRAMHSDLFEKYAGQYVAVYNGDLVDFDTDESNLYRRIDQRYLNGVVLMKKVEKSPEKVYHFRSPRFIREA